MSFWDRGIIDEIGQSSQQKQKIQEKEQGRLQKITMYLIFYFALTYPFTLIGFIPYLIFRSLNKKDLDQHIGELEHVSLLEKKLPIFMIGASFFLILNLILLFLVMPNAYLSNYLLFPFNFIKSNLRYTFISFICLILGGIGQSFMLLAITSFLDKRKVVSKEERQDSIQKSKEYQELKENKFNRVRQSNRKYNHQKSLAILSDDEQERQKYNDELFMGVDEYGKDMVIKFLELNQHALATGTTGSGKTTLVMNFVDYAIEHNIPILYLDGKGAVDTLKSVETIASKYKKTVKVFSDTHDLRYNPIKHGNAVMIRDRLVSLAETESVYYTASAKSLLQSTIQLLDLFKVPRTLENVSDYTLPRNVLLLFLKVIQEHKEDVLFVEVAEEKPKKKKKKASKEETEGQETLELSDDELNDIDLLAEELDSDQGEQTRLEELNPHTMMLEQLYYLIRHYKYYFNDSQQKLFKQLFTRYEHKDNPFYLYATSESLQTNINMLIDSDLGHLFDTTQEGCEELDLLEDSKSNEVMFITLNGLVYKDYIKTLAQFFISELNYLASEQYIYNEHMPFLLICDEPSVYINENFIDTVNKGRGAGLHTVFSPQTLTDIDIINPKLTKQLIGNCNSFYIGQANVTDEIDDWASLIGTYKDIELTTVTEQEQGYSDVERSDWSGSRGTKRNVRNLIIHPDTIKDLRTGEFIVYRKANNIREQARRLYANNPANR